MAKSITALKDVLVREEKILAKLQDAISLIAHKETKSLIRGIVKAKRGDIKTYKKIIRESEKCPAVQRTGKGAAEGKAPTGAVKKAVKRTAKKR